FGERIQFSPAVDAAAAGGPLLDLAGHVVGILGGSLHQGARRTGRLINLGPGFGGSLQNENAATPISELPDNLDGPGTTLESLAADGTLTVPVSPMQEMLYGGATNQLPKGAVELTPRELSDFSRN